MDRSNDKRGMRVQMRSFFGGTVSLFVPVRMIMNVGRPIVRVLMRVQPRLETPPQSPNSNSDQENPNDSFRPTRKRLDGQKFARDQREQSDKQHPARMSKSPSEPNAKSLPPPIQGERRDGRQMVRS
jgi:hypothetical protein